MIVGIHHAEITIPRNCENRARAFYCDFLGLSEIAKPRTMGRGGFWLQVGNRTVHVGIEDSADRLGTRAHLAYEVTELDNWRRRVEEAGIAIEEPPLYPGHLRFKIRDPFGNQLEFIQRNGASEL
ncbi:MAG: VOC family protein [Tepidisphaeraceae bacterium]